MAGQHLGKCPPCRPTNSSRHCDQVLTRYRFNVGHIATCSQGSINHHGYCCKKVTTYEEFGVFLFCKCTVSYLKSFSCHQHRQHMQHLELWFLDLGRGACSSMLQGHGLYSHLAPPNLAGQFNRTIRTAGTPGQSIPKLTASRVTQLFAPSRTVKEQLPTSDTWPNLRSPYQNSTQHGGPGPGRSGPGRALQECSQEGRQDEEDGAYVCVHHSIFGSSHRSLNQLIICRLLRRRPRQRSKQLSPSVRPKRPLRISLASSPRRTRTSRHGTRRLSSRPR